MSTETTHNLSLDAQTPATHWNGELTLDETFKLLSSSRRRAIIEILDEYDRLDKGAVVDKVAELEYGRPIDEISSKPERHTVYVALNQCHFPHLESADVIEWDGNEIEMGPNASEVVGVLKNMKRPSTFGGWLKRSFAALC